MSFPFVDSHRLQDFSSCSIVGGRLRQASPRRTLRHAHSCGQLLGTVSGLVSITSDHLRSAVPPISAIWIPPHVQHELSSHGPFDGWSVYIAEAVCTRLPPHPCIIRLSDLLREAILRASTWGDDMALSRKANISNVILDEIEALPEDRLTLPMPRDPQLARLAKMIADDPAERLGFQQCAREAGMAPRTLSRKFSQETGLTLRTWRQRAVLLRSLELLAGGNSVTSVALDLGYETVSGFIDLFRNHFGVTPARYFDHRMSPDHLENEKS